MTGKDLARCHSCLVCDSRPQEEEKASSDHQAYSRPFLERGKGHTNSRKGTQNSRTSRCIVQNGTWRHPIHTENRMPVEVTAKGVWLRFHLPPEVPGVGQDSSISETMGQITGIWRCARYQMEMAVTWQLHLSRHRQGNSALITNARNRVTLNAFHDLPAWKAQHSLQQARLS